MDAGGILASQSYATSSATATTTEATAPTTQDATSNSQTADIAFAHDAWNSFSGETQLAVAQTGRFPEWIYGEAPPDQLVEEMVDVANDIVEGEMSETWSEPEPMGWSFEIGGETLIVEEGQQAEVIAAAQQQLEGLASAMDVRLAGGTRLQQELALVVQQTGDIWMALAKVLAWDFSQLPDASGLEQATAAVAEFRAAVASGDLQLMADRANEANEILNEELERVYSFQDMLAQRGEKAADRWIAISLTAVTAAGIAFAAAPVALGGLGYSSAGAAAASNAVVKLGEGIASEVQEYQDTGTFEASDVGDVILGSAIAAAAAAGGTWAGEAVGRATVPLQKRIAGGLASLGYEASDRAVTWFTEKILENVSSSGVETALNHVGELVTGEMTWEEYGETWTAKWEEDSMLQFLQALAQEACETGVVAKAVTAVAG